MSTDFAVDGFAPTAEQESIVTAALEGEGLAVTARAGTGKTATVALISRALSPRRGLYLAFNRSTAAEARAKMPPNVEACTAHALAYRALGHRYQERLRGPRRSAAHTAAVLGITAPLPISDSVVFSPTALAAQVMEMVRRYCHSDHTQIQTAHAAPVPGLDRDQHRHLAEYLLPLAHLAWTDLQKTDGQGGLLRLTHDHYLKMWALTRPVLDYDFLCLDEAQDTNPVLARVVRDQQAQQIIVGDSAQAIYGWRGAKDTLESWPVPHRRSLTHSWRFGERIAQEANVWLQQVGVALRLTGNAGIESTIGPVEGPEAILCRTNAGAMGQALKQMRAGRGVALLGGVSGVRAMAGAARDLRDGRGTDHPELVAFTSWAQVREYVEQAPQEAGELKSFVELVDEHGPEQVLSATQRMGSEKDAQVVCGTVHKAKGRQWDTVEVAEDFTEPLALKEGVPGPVSREEAMLAYVAITRPRYRLDNTGLAWIHHRTTSVRPPKLRVSAPQARRPSAGSTVATRPLPPWPALDLQATYTAHIPGLGERVITPKIKKTHRRTSRTQVTGLHPLLAHKLAVLSDEDRPHVEMLVHSAWIAITDEADQGPDLVLIPGLIVARDRGRLATNYQGHPDLTRQDMLDLAEHLRAHLNGTVLEQRQGGFGQAAVVEEDGWPTIPAVPARSQITRQNLSEDIARHLDHSGVTDIDPAAVAAAVVERYGLIAWDQLEQHQVHLVLSEVEAE